MRLVRYDQHYLGALVNGSLLDVSGALDAIGPLRWPLPQADAMVAKLPQVLEHVAGLLGSARPVDINAVTINSPVANPSKIIGVPINYRDHVEEIKHDPIMLQAMGGEIKPISHYGLILKAPSSLRGPGEGIRIAFPERRNDHEIELAIIIGKPGRRIKREDASAHIAGYAVSLDMTLRGTEDRSLRKSLDTYSIVGPALVTPDEVPDTKRLGVRLAVNGTPRQASNTNEMIMDISEVIAFASGFFHLNPGDIIMTGTPGGVGPVKAGDLIEAEIESIGSMKVSVLG
jgi:2,4-diketo-3-deoxy-L-fuconate hydrolase